MQSLSTARQQAELQTKAVAQAENVARAGLTEALAWFRNQPSQPVRSSINTVLYPYPDAAFNPLAVNGDTINQSIGIVREYQLVDGTWLWGHYEVRRQQNPGSNPIDPNAVHDITDRRIQGHQAGEGLYWYIQSDGYVYRLKNPGVAYNQAPNQVVGTSHVSTEIRRLGLTLPANCAVIVNSRNNVTLQTNGRIVGGTAGVGLGYYLGNSGSGLAQATGTPPLLDIPGVGVTTMTITSQIVFGDSPSSIKEMADITVSTVGALSASYPTMAVVYVDGNATFDGTHQLIGGGVLFVNGNLTISSGANTLFNGVIYVVGNATITGSQLISGCLVVQGSLTMNGIADVSEVDFDSGILNAVRQQVGQYRENKSAYFNLSGIK